MQTARGGCMPFPSCPSLPVMKGKICMTEEIFNSQMSNCLDLHNFRFSEIDSLLEEFIWSCVESGFKDGIIIHGKGMGTQRDLVHQKLKNHPNVTTYHLDGENWGRTIFMLSV